MEGLAAMRKMLGFMGLLGASLLVLSGCQNTTHHCCNSTRLEMQTSCCGTPYSQGKQMKFVPLITKIDDQLAVEGGTYRIGNTVTIESTVDPISGFTLKNAYAFIYKNKDITADKVESWPPCNPDSVASSGCKVVKGTLVAANQYAFANVEAQADTLPPPFNNNTLVVWGQYEDAAGTGQILFVKTSLRFIGLKK